MFVSLLLLYAPISTCHHSRQIPLAEERHGTTLEKATAVVIVWDLNVLLVLYCLMQGGAAILWQVNSVIHPLLLFKVWPNPDKPTRCKAACMFIFCDVRDLVPNVLFTRFSMRRVNGFRSLTPANNVVSGGCYSETNDSAGPLKKECAGFCLAGAA